MRFHIPEIQSQVLAGKVGLVTGIANDQSIAFGCARALRRCWSQSRNNLPEREGETLCRAAGRRARSRVVPAARRAASRADGGRFTAIREKWGRLDFLVHSLAFAPKSDL